MITAHLIGGPKDGMAVQLDLDRLPKEVTLRGLGYVDWSAVRGTEVVETHELVYVLGGWEDFDDADWRAPSGQYVYEGRRPSCLDS